MEQDTRIGLAMGILLIGVVGALFFRNEQMEQQTFPTVSDPDSLDARIAERPIAPYLSPRAKQTTAPPTEVVDTGEKAWTVPEFLKDDRTVSPPTGAAGPPEPIPKQAVTATPPVRQEESIFADEPPLVVTDDAPAAKAPSDLAEYKVKSGDTLSDISEKFLGSSARYMEIYELNKDRLKTPHDLRIGRSIRVPRRF